MLGLQVLVVCVSPVCDPAACFPRDFGSSCQYINRLESENCPNEYLNGNSFASCWSVEIPVAAVTLVELEMFALRVFSGRRNYRSRCGLLLVLSRQFWFDMMVLAIVLASVLLLPPLLLLIVLSSFQIVFHRLLFQIACAGSCRHARSSDPGPCSFENLVDPGTCESCVTCVRKDLSNRFRVTADSGRHLLTTTDDRDHDDEVEDDEVEDEACEDVEVEDEDVRTRTARRRRRKGRTTGRGRTRTRCARPLQRGRQR